MAPQTQRNAPYNTRCKACHRCIRKGEMVWYAKHLGARCISCGAHPDQPTAPAAPARKRPAPMPGHRAAVLCDDGVYRHGFDSVGEAIDDVLADYAQNESSRQFCERELKARWGAGVRHRWSGGYNAATLRKAVSNPKADLLDAVEQMRERLVGNVKAPMAPRRRVRRGCEFGDQLDSDRWLARSMTPWDRSVRELHPQKVVTIGCNLSISAKETANVLKYRGAAAAALADVLTARGYSVRVLAYESGGEPTSTVAHSVATVVLKAPTMPLDLGALVFALCDVGFYRHFFLGTMRHLPGQHYETCGYPRKLPERDSAQCDYVVEMDVRTEEQAAAWLDGIVADRDAEAVPA